MMQVVILAGGSGTRMKSVAGSVPKVLIPVAGRPFIEHQFALLMQSGIRDVLLCVGHLGQLIEDHVGDGSRWGLHVQYAREDPAHLLGTGGALVNALPHLQASFVVMYGDSFLPVDYASFMNAFEQCRQPAMMSVFRNQGRWDHSNTRVAEGQVVFYDKRAAAGTAEFIDYGLTAFRREVIQRYASRPMPLDMAVILQELVKHKTLAAWEAPRRFYEIGKPEGLVELEQFLATLPHQADSPCCAAAVSVAPSPNTATRQTAKATALHPAIFLDRDGTINEMVYDETHGLLDSPRRPEQVSLIPHAAEFIRGAHDAGYKIVVVTNQPGIAKGTLTLAELGAVNQRLAELLAAEDAHWDALYFCPHHPQGDGRADNPYVQECACRKPKPGLLLRAAAELEVDLKASWMMGDGLNDVQAGHAAGCRSILVTQLKVEQIERLFTLPNGLPANVVPDLATALRKLLRC